MICLLVDEPKLEAFESGGASSVRVMDPDHSPASDNRFSGETTVALSALAGMYYVLGQGKRLADFHQQGRIYLGGGNWAR